MKRNIISVFLGIVLGFCILSGTNAWAGRTGTDLYMIGTTDFGPPRLLAHEYLPVRFTQSQVQMAFGFPLEVHNEAEVYDWQAPTGNWYYFVIYYELTGVQWLSTIILMFPTVTL